MIDGIHEVALSKSKIIKQESAGSITPHVEINALCLDGNVCKASNADIDEGDWAKSSTML